MTFFIIATALYVKNSIEILNTHRRNSLWISKASAITNRDGVRHISSHCHGLNALTRIHWLDVGPNPANHLPLTSILTVNVFSSTQRFNTYSSVKAPNFYHHNLMLILWGVIKKTEPIGNSN